VKLDFFNGQWTCEVVKLIYLIDEGINQSSRANQSKQALYLIQSSSGAAACNGVERALLLFFIETGVGTGVKIYWA
jgi:hypothetical protein